MSLSQVALSFMANVMEIAYVDEKGDVWGNILEKSEEVIHPDLLSSFKCYTLFKIMQVR